jgi:mannose-6-phosphate isomerase-like protein (cupin superfamily)
MSRNPAPFMLRSPSEKSMHPAREGSLVLWVTGYGADGPETRGVRGIGPRNEIDFALIQSFVRGLLVDQGSLAIVGAIVGLGVSFGMITTADDVLHLVEGRIAVWMPDRCLTMTPGDLVFLPKGVEHAWRAYGEKSVRMDVTISPGGFEHFFPTIQVSGPPLSGEEIEGIIAQG